MSYLTNFIGRSKTCAGCISVDRGLELAVIKQPESRVAFCLVVSACVFIRLCCSELF